MFKTCRSCNIQFEITDEDLKFYEKVSPSFGGKKYLIPPPSLCPHCRVQRRMAFRNDRSLYQRKCDKSGELFVSLYQPDSPFAIYKASEWYKDDWDPLDFGQEFDFSKSFFQQFYELMLKVPRLGMTTVNMENSDYCPYSSDAKNCYLDIAAEGNEDCYYNLFVKYSKNIVDSTFVYNSELNYECINSYNIYNCKYGMYLDNCSDCVFCFDLKGCKNCIFSNNLRQKEYFIFNKQYSKEDYEKQLKELNLSSYQNLQNNIELWKENMGTAIHRDVYTLNCENCDGNDIKNSKNCHNVSTLLIVRILSICMMCLRRRIVWI